MIKLYKHLLLRLRQRRWKLDLKRTAALISSDKRWQFMDDLGIPGFGTDLMRVDFLQERPIDGCWNQEDATFELLAELIDKNSEFQMTLLSEVVQCSSVIDSFPVDEEPSLGGPWKDNAFFSRLDMIGLYGLMKLRRPEVYIEIGSGMSTRVAVAAVTGNDLKTKIHCIDPRPRINLPFDQVIHHKQTLETSISTVLDAAVPGSFLFFDGSHRSLPGSDVTVFFMSLIPRLPAGVVVHIHDIYLPWDYPPSRLNRFWSEQYLLAAWLLGGASQMKVLLPGKRLEDAALKQFGLTPAFTETSAVRNWTSFWFETV